MRNDESQDPMVSDIIRDNPCVQFGHEGVWRGLKVGYVEVHRGRVGLTGRLVRCHLELSRQEDTFYCKLFDQQVAIGDQQGWG